MIERDGLYIMPILTREIADQTRGLNKADWPKGILAEYQRQHKAFTAAKGEYRMWIRRDRDSRMRGQAKAIACYILDCLNFDRGQCDPSHQAIADELGLSLRTVERTVPRIKESGWFVVQRRGTMASNFYRFQVSKAKVSYLLEAVDDLKNVRKEKFEARKQSLLLKSDPPKLADHSLSDPPPTRSHDPTEMAVHDPTEMAGKSMKRTLEGEPVKKGISSGGREESLYSDIDQSEFDTDHRKTVNPYEMASRGYGTLEDDQPFPVPNSIIDAEIMIDSLCASSSVPEALRERMLTMLQRGILTPAMAGRLIDPMKRNAA